MESTASLIYVLWHTANALPNTHTRTHRSLCIWNQIQKRAQYTANEWMYWWPWTANGTHENERRKNQTACWYNVVKCICRWISFSIWSSHKAHSLAIGLSSKSRSHFIQTILQLFTNASRLFIHKRLCTKAPFKQPRRLLCCLRSAMLLHDELLTVCMCVCSSRRSFFFATLYSVLSVNITRHAEQSSFFFT